jgi:uncharacterized membrane protein YphA (DoxX/SURF4 family)
MLALTGLDMPDVAITLLRVTMGLFFFISGYHKLFNAARHATVAQTMIVDHVPDPKFSSWFVPIAEFLGGWALVAGFFTPVAAAGLFIICCGATLMDGLKRIKNWKPIDKADYVDDVLYLPEVMYAFILLALVLTGGGPWSFDQYILWSLYP